MVGIRRIDSGAYAIELIGAVSKTEAVGSWTGTGYDAVVVEGSAVRRVIAKGIIGYHTRRHNRRHALGIIQIHYILIG